MRIVSLCVDVLNHLETRGGGFVFSQIRPDLVGDFQTNNKLAISLMSSSKLQPRLLVLLCMLAIWGCNRDAPETEVRVDETVASLEVDELVASFDNVNLETEADVQHVVSNAAASPRAIMFVHLDWASMEPQRTRFAEFMLEYQRTYPDGQILFHYVDCTPVTNGYAPLRSLPGWQKLHEAAGTSLIHGWGELVWMEKGRVLHVERILDCGSAAELVEKTDRLLPTLNNG